MRILDFADGFTSATEPGSSGLNITDTTTSTNTTTGALRVAGGVGIVENLNVGGNAIVTGNVTINGTTTAINTTTMDVADSNITVNKDGNQAAANLNDAGLTVEMSDATNAKIGYDSSLASKFHAGEVGSEAELITSTHTQSMSAKTITSSDIDLGTATNTNKLVVSKDTTANLTALTREAGSVYYSTDDDVYKGDDGTSLISLGTSATSKYSTNALDSDVGSTTSDIAVLKFINLTVGKHYRIGGQALLIADAAGGIGTLDLVNNSVIVASAHMDVNGASGVSKYTLAFNTIFEAAGTTLQANFTDGSNATLSGDGTFKETYIQLEEIASINTTTDWD